jgi:hypothetical protein
LATGKQRLSVPCGTLDHWFQLVAISPDGQTLAATTPSGSVHLWDLHGAKKLATRTTTSGEMESIAFSHDSRNLATGHRDGNIFVWDLSGIAGRPEPPTPQPDAAQIERWWSDLAGEARPAYLAIRGLSSASGQSVRLLGERLRPVVPGAADPIQKMIADLDGPEFARREVASKELIKLGEPAGPALRAALKLTSSAEVRERIERVLRTHDPASGGEVLRQVRAIEALESLDSEDSRVLLEKLAGGIPEARLTREARSALQERARRAAAR